MKPYAFEIVVVILFVVAAMVVAAVSAALGTPAKAGADHSRDPHSVSKWEGRCPVCEHHQISTGWGDATTIGGIASGGPGRTVYFWVECPKCHVVYGLQPAGEGQAK